MKYIIIPILMIFISCVEVPPTYPQITNDKFNIGDVVYVKPDSLKAVITKRSCACGEWNILYSGGDRSYGVDQRLFYENKSIDEDTTY